MKFSLIFDHKRVACADVDGPFGCWQNLTTYTHTHTVLMKFATCMTGTGEEKRQGKTRKDKGSGFSYRFNPTTHQRASTTCGSAKKYAMICRTLVLMLQLWIFLGFLVLMDDDKCSPQNNYMIISESTKAKETATGWRYRLKIQLLHLNAMPVLKDDCHFDILISCCLGHCSAI